MERDALPLPPSWEQALNTPLAQTRVDELPSILTLYPARVASAMRTAALAPRSMTGRMSGYHMGWLDETGHERRSVTGKLIRPSLCLWACDACGGDTENALAAATALEWVHNFTLVHDDIQDGDRDRHGRPTLWTLWGVAQGINAGDALHALAFRVLTESGADPERTLRAVRALSTATLEVVEGQCLDLALEGRVQVPVHGYLRMVRAKTGALLGAALEIGALIAGASPATARRYRRAGYLLGLAFQMRDDWLGTWGDSAITGKSSAGDIGRRKASFALVAAYHALPPHEQRRLLDAFAQRTDEATREIRVLLEDAGGAELTRTAPLRFAEKAVAVIASCDVPAQSLTAFREMAGYVASRSH
ncbi:MAG TPA: polyprenyl synthetase family protein [Candidatus Tyrphobacter sp.]